MEFILSIDVKIELRDSVRRTLIEILENCDDYEKDIESCTEVFNILNKEKLDLKELTNLYSTLRILGMCRRFLVSVFEWFEVIVDNKKGS